MVHDYQTKWANHEDKSVQAGAMERNAPRGTTGESNCVDRNQRMLLLL